MNKNTESTSVGPLGPEQKMKPCGKSQCQSKLLEELSSTSKSHVQKTKRSQEVDIQPDEVNQELNEEESNYFNQNPYVQQYYTGYVNMHHVLDGNLAAIHSELHYMSRGVYRLTSGMKECSDTMDFYVRRMLSLQKEMLYALDKTNSSLQNAVHLLRKIKENQEKKPQGSSSATQHTEQNKESDGANIRQKEQKNHHRSRSEDRSTKRHRRYKEK